MVIGDTLRDRWTRNRFAAALVVITFAGLLGRIVYVIWMRNQAVLGDGYAYHLTVLAFVDGRASIEPLHPPGWSLVLSGPSALGMRSWLSHQLFTALIGTATIPMTGLAGRAAFGPRVGVIAAALVAVAPQVWLYEREIVAEPLAMLMVATTIWLAYRFRAKPSLLLVVALGGAVGVMAMTRSELAAIGVLVVAPLILSSARDNPKRGIVWLGAAAIAVVIVIAPWTAYNASRYERLVPLSTGLGPTMTAGNCDATYRGELLGYYKFGCVLLLKVDPDPSIADGELRRHALDYMRDHLSRTPVIAAARVGRTFGVFRPAQQTHLETERGTDLWVIRSGFVLYSILLPFAAAGVVFARRACIPVYPLLAFPLVVLISVLPTIGSVRYRAPAEIPLIILAAVGIDAAIRAWRRHTARRERAAMTEVSAGSAP